MKQELVRINSMDEIEQPGILYIPDKTTDKIVIHVHGLNGNFYENRFLDTLAKSYTDKGYAFLTFNNRGKDFIAELLKGDGFTVIGGSLEITLEGHSYGCNKVLYYYNKKKEDCINKIVLLAPCDIPSEGKKFLSEEEYNKAKVESTRLVNEGKENELIDFSVMANGKIAAGTYYNDFLPGGENDFIRYTEDINDMNEVLNSIDIPVLVVFGDADECVLTQPIDKVKVYLNNNIKNCTIKIINGADHSYCNKYEELGIIISKNF